MSTWDAAKHPRRRDGRFGRGEIWAQSPEPHLDTGSEWIQPSAQVTAHRPENSEALDPHEVKAAADFDEFVEHCNREEYAERTSVEGAVPRVPTTDDYAFLGVLPYSQRRQAEIAFKALAQVIETRAADRKAGVVPATPPMAPITTSEALVAIRDATAAWHEEHPDAPDDAEEYAVDLIGGES